MVEGPGGDGDGGFAWNPAAGDGHALRRSSAGEGDREGGTVAEGFVDDGAEVGEEFDFVVGGDDVVLVEGGGEFFVQGLHHARVADEVEHGVLEGAGGGFGAGVYEKAALLDEFTHVHGRWDAVAGVIEAFEEIGAFFAVALDSEARADEVNHPVGEDLAAFDAAVECEEFFVEFEQFGRGEAEG